MSSPITLASSRTRILTTIALFGFASGLPLALTGSTLQAWLTQAGIEIKTLGALTLVGVPYTFKFLWAPLIDRYPLGQWSRRRGWLVATQATLALVCLAFAMTEPNVALPRILFLALLMAAVSATQDIAVDAYRAEALETNTRGLGAGFSVAGYRIAMIVSGAGALILADRYGFAWCFYALSGLFVLSVLMTFFAPEPARSTHAPSTLTDAFVVPLQSLMTQPRIIGCVALIALYKLGDAFAGSLTMTFLLRGQGFSLTEIGSIYKVLGIVATIVGGILGGAWQVRVGLYRALIVFGLLQAITNGGFLWLATLEKSLPAMITVVGLENFSAGMGTSALLALMMSLCDRRYTATHFALLSAVASLARVFIGPLAGQVAAHGWVIFFNAAVFLAVPGLIMVWLMRERIERVQYSG